MISNISYVTDLSPALMAIHLAVSTLSPVSIQNLIPPWHKDSMVPYISS